MLLKLLDPEKEVPEQAFAKPGYLVPEPAPDFAVPVTNINTPLFGNGPRHRSTFRYEDPP